MLSGAIRLDGSMHQGRGAQCYGRGTVNCEMMFTALHIMFRASDDFRTGPCLCNVIVAGEDGQLEKIKGKPLNLGLWFEVISSSFIERFRLPLCHERSQA